MFDTKALAEATALVVKQHLATAVQPLLKRIEELEARVPLNGKDGADGRDGSSVSLDDVAPLIAEAVTKAIGAIPVPVNGKDGVDGSSVTVDDLAPLVSDVVAKAIADIPAPMDGRDGVDGEPGADGKDAPTLDEVAELVRQAVSQIPPPRDGADGASVTVEDIEPIIAEHVQRAVSALPAPTDGKDGRDGVDGKDGRDGADGVHGEAGKDGLDGLHGKDGRGIADLLINQDGALVASFTDGATKSVGRVVGGNGNDGAPGRDGADGANGKDGFSLKNFDAELMPDGRTLLLKFADATDTSFAVELGIPAIIYRDVFKDGQSYERGDVVTWAGSLWHCNEPTTDKPGEGAKAWTLAAKRGRDGKDGVVVAREAPKKVRAA